MKLKTKLTTKPHKEKVLKFDWKIPKNLLNDLKYNISIFILNILKILNPDLIF